jgi:hypothetical protein
MHMKNMNVFSGVKMNCKAVLAGVFCLSMATGVYAAQNEKPCAADAAKLCKGVQQGQGRVAQCLKEHANELSPACKENIEKVKEKVQELKEACKDDSAKLCKGMRPGGGRILQCLKQHEGELSPACKAKLNQSRGKQK